MSKMTASCWENYPNFKPKEFRCKCGKCKESKTDVVDMDCRLLRILQKVRSKYGEPMTITSGYRCKEYNNSIKGSVPNSYHTKKKACDFQLATKCNTYKGRAEVMEYMKTLEGYKYTYCNTDKNDKPNMGKAIHIEVK